MISEWTYIVLIITELALFIYMFADLDNRLYGNIFASAISAVLAGLLGLWAFNGNIGTVEAVINTTSVNETIGQTVYTYTTQTVEMVDPTLGWFWILWMGAMVGLTGYFAIEAWMEKIAPEVEDDY